MDRHIDKATALVINGNATARSVMVSQLRDLGIGQVHQVSRIAEARLRLERVAADIVLCDDHFEGSEMSGQDLLDELRREALLPYSTVFIMVIGEATYARVVEAAEAALDGVLIRPYTTAVLAERLREARKRKRALKAVFDAVADNDLVNAIRLCMSRFRQLESYGLFCARLGGELLLRLDRCDEARQLFTEIAGTAPVRWASLGAARALHAGGDGVGARRAVESLIEQGDDSADALDVLGHIRVDQGDFEQALLTYRMASQKTPGCLLRLQHCATLAFYEGHTNEALRLLERTIATGLKSKLFDALTLMLVALIRFDAGDSKALSRLQTQLQQFVQRHAQSARLRRFDTGITALRDALLGQPASAQALVTTLLDESRLEDFDLEGANLTLALLARVPATQDSPVFDLVPVRRLAMRFSTSKAITEALVASARGLAGAEEVIRQCHGEIATMAEKSLLFSVRGQPEQAVRTLLAQGEATRNAKLIDMAQQVLRRHQAVIGDTSELGALAYDMQRRLCHPVTHIAGVRRTGRSPGGMVVRA